MKLVVAPAVWLGHFTVVYVLHSLVCAAGVESHAAFGVGIARLGVAAATVVALALIAAAASVDLRRPRTDGSESEPFIARVTLLACALSALAVLWVAYPAFVLPACAS